MRDSQPTIPDGYKQTDVGVIPEDWNVKKIKEVCVLINGRGFKPHEWSKQGLPIIRIQNLNGSEEFNYFDGSYAPKILVDKGRLLFAWSGSRGTSFGPHVWSGDLALLNYHTWKIDLKDCTLDKKFFFHYLKKLTSQIEDVAHGAAALVHTQKGEMENFLLALPSPTEQQAIAEVLSDVDALITSLDRLIAKKRNLKQGAMQLLLTGKQRLAGFSGEWGTKLLSQLINHFIVPMKDKPKEFKGNIPWCRIEDFDGKYLSDSKSKQYVNAEIINYMNLKIHPTETVLVSCSANLGECAIVKKPLVTNQTFIGLVVNESKLSNEFLYYYMIYNAEELNKLSSGTTISYLSREQFENFEVFIPSTVEEQKAIARILSDMDAEIEALEKRREKYTAVKQGMMQELLTGKTRLVKPAATSETSV